MSKRARNTKVSLHLTKAKQESQYDLEDGDYYKELDKGSESDGGLGKNNSVDSLNELLHVNNADNP